MFNFNTSIYGSNAFFGAFQATQFSNPMMSMMGSNLGLMPQLTAGFGAFSGSIFPFSGGFNSSPFGSFGGLFGSPSVYPYYANNDFGYIGNPGNYPNDPGVAIPGTYPIDAGTVMPMPGPYPIDSGFWQPIPGPYPFSNFMPW